MRPKTDPDRDNQLVVEALSGLPWGCGITSTATARKAGLSLKRTLRALRRLRERRLVQRSAFWYGQLAHTYLYALSKKGGK